MTSYDKEVKLWCWEMEETLETKGKVVISLEGLVSEYFRFYFEFFAIPETLMWILNPEELTFIASLGKLLETFLGTNVIDHASLSHPWEKTELVL